MYLNIGEKIKTLRKENNLTQEELAEQIHVTSQAVSKWESGAGLPDITQVAPLAKVLKVSADILLDISVKITHRQHNLKKGRVPPW